MNDTRTKQKAIILWVSGLAYSDISAIAEVETLVAQGVKVDLLPSLITGTQSQYYQMMSASAPASFGFFDTLIPAYQVSRPLHGQSGYAIVEENAGRDAAPRFFPDILRTAGWSVELLEVPFSELVEKTQALLGDSTPAPICKIISTRLDSQSLAGEAASLAETLRQARAWVGEDGLLALLCDAPSVALKRGVNINNFLLEMGLIERDEQDGSIDWSNSLAYYAGHGQLWVNLLGREPQGAVHPQDEYAEVCDSLMKALPTRLRDSVSGEQVVERVYRKDEIYSGDYLFCAPDLIVQFMAGYAPSQGSSRLEFDEQVFTQPSTEAARRAGVDPRQAMNCLLAVAPSLRANESLSEPAALTAFAPTLLHALGVDYAGMESAAIEAVYLPAYLEGHPIRFQKQSQELSEEDEELVIGRLRDLGYI